MKNFKYPFLRENICATSTSILNPSLWTGRKAESIEIIGIQAVISVKGFHALESKIKNFEIGNSRLCW